MDLILDFYRGYGIEYDTKNKIITINKKMPVKEFMQLREILKRTTAEVKEIRLYSSRLMKVRKTT